MSNPKILLIEDSPETQVVIKGVLGKKYEVVIAETAADALTKIGADGFALILLDVELPDGDGFDLYSKLKSGSLTDGTPIVFLTGRKEASDKVLGFSLGADDYIVKPIEPAEFQARIDLRIKKAKEASAPKTKYQNGLFNLELANQSVIVRQSGSDQELDLTSIEFKLLYFFLTHEEEVLSREKILHEIWGENVHITDRTIDTHVYTLRQKLGALSAMIHSVPRVGYKFSHTPSVDKGQSKP